MSMASLDQNEKEKIDLYIPKATDSQPNPWVMYETLEAALAEKDRNAPVAVQLAGAAPEALAAWLAETHQPALKAACQITGDPGDPNSMTGPADKDDGDAPGLGLRTLPPRGGQRGGQPARPPRNATPARYRTPQHC